MAPAKKRSKASSAVAAAAQWKIGDLVLAKVKGFPAWPAQVSKPEGYGRQRNPARVFVVFFGTQQIRFCHHSEISPFTIEARAALHTRVLSKCVPSDLRHAVKEICEVADETNLNLGRPKDLDVRSPAREVSEEQSSSNAEGKPDRPTGSETSLESRRSSGLQSCKRSRRIRRRLSEDGSQGGLVKNPQSQWESSCTNSCNSGILEEQGPVKSGTDRVVECSGEQASRPEGFSWSKHSFRTATRHRKLSFFHILQGRKKDDGPDDRTSRLEEGFGESLERKAKSVKTKRKTTIPEKRTSQLRRHVQDCSEVDSDPDRHLPLFKRARARVMHGGPGQSVARKIDGNLKEEPSGKPSENRCRKSLLDVEAVSKRHHRALEAMSICAIEAEMEKHANAAAETSGEPDFIRRRSQKAKCEKVGKSRSMVLKNKKHKQPTGPDGAHSCLRSGLKSAKSKAVFGTGTYLKRKLAQYCRSSKTMENLGDLQIFSSTSRFPSEDVNRVREAYEAAKEKKQKLASKNASAPSTSMKYLLAAAQTKQMHLASSALFHKNLDHEADMSAEADAAQDMFERMLGSVARAKDSIGRVTRQAADCARFGASEQVIDILATKMESEQRLHRRIDLFLVVDSIVQWSHSQRGTPAGAYRSLVQNTLPRLLSAAAPPGSLARDNRRHCSKILTVWLDRKIFPECIVRHFLREIEYHDCEKPTMNSNSRPSRTERPMDDPIREMEGMQVDEYGSNASFPLPGFAIQQIGDDEDSGPSEIPLMNDPAASLNNEPVQRHRRILEEVDGELEMEDVSPVAVDYVRGFQEYPAFQQAPPLPSAPPPSTPPPPPLDSVHQLKLC